MCARPFRNSFELRPTGAFPRWLAAAAVLHALAILGVAYQHTQERAVTLQPPLRSEPIEFAWDVEPEAAVVSPAQTTPAPERRAPASAPLRLAARVPSGAVRAEAAAQTGVSGGEAGVAEAGDADSETAAIGSSEAAPGASPAAGPRLSLEALGVGPANNPFLAPSGAAPSARAQLAARIDHMLRQGLAEHDQGLGLGPEGPAVAAVEALVMQSTTAPNTRAKLLLRTDASGETVHVEMLEASGDTAAWNAIAQDLLRTLRGKKLRIPTGTGGVSMQLEVTSRNTLPSGADPGLAVDLFGTEIKSGEGDKSTRLQLLTPKLEVHIPDHPNHEMDPDVPALNIQLVIVGVMGDPVDIAAVARRVVHARLVALETHPKEPQ